METQKKTLNELALAELLEGALSAALAAGDILKRGYAEELEIKEKTGHHDLVTKYDRLAEKAILKILKGSFPKHGFITEESGVHGTLKEDIIWCIDPLDGTWNFAHKIPTFSVSIAALHDWQPVIGIIYHPLLSELFVAKKGGGATLNGKPLKVSRTKELARAGISFGLSLHGKEDYPQVVNRIHDLTRQHVMVRRTGSAALDLAYVAAARLDGFFEPSLNSWDIAAGSLVLAEAKGVVTTIEGKPLQFHTNQSILAANPHIHDELLKFFKHPKKYYSH